MVMLIPWCPMIRFLSPLLLASLLLLGCQKEQPVRVERPDLGVVATFPGQPRFVVYPERTPFGFLEWNSLAYLSTTRLDEHYQVDVASIPPGKAGGTSVTEVLDTFHRQVLERNYSSVVRKDLPAGEGEGFSFSAKGVGKAVMRGKVLVKDGRLFRVQATGGAGSEARLEAFVDSFRMTY